MFHQTAKQHSTHTTLPLNQNRKKRRSNGQRTIKWTTGQKQRPIRRFRSNSSRRTASGEQTGKRTQTTKRTSSPLPHLPGGTSLCKFSTFTVAKCRLVSCKSSLVLNEPPPSVSFLLIKSFEMISMVGSITVGVIVLVGGVVVVTRYCTRRQQVAALAAETCPHDAPVVMSDLVRLLLRLLSLNYV